MAGNFYGTGTVFSWNSGRKGLSGRAIFFQCPSPAQHLAEAEGEGPHMVMAIIRQFVERGRWSVEAEFFLC